jgi:transcriptional regulator with XRE-family HTH domain
VAGGAGRDALETNEIFRADVHRYIELGIDQKVLARKMGVTESWFSRWFRRKNPKLVISVTAINGLTEYIRELTHANDQFAKHAIELMEQIAQAARPAAPRRPHAPSKRKGA